MIPNARRHDPSPAYLRSLVERSGLSQAAAAELVGVAPRTLRAYLSHNPDAYQVAPYAVQFALEALAGGSRV